MMAQVPSPVPRGRHAPPREVREGLQRERLFDAAADVFATQGYADASAEAISRAAGMSKATFYEHFANKRECMLQLVDHASELALRRLVKAAREAGDVPVERHRAGLRAFLGIVEAYPAAARTALVVSIGAGAEAQVKRDAILDRFAEVMFEETRLGVETRGGGERFVTMEDAFALVGAIAELVGRQLRTGRPAQINDLEPVVERLLSAVLIDPR